MANLGVRLQALNLAWTLKHTTIEVPFSYNEMAAKRALSLAQRGDETAIFGRVIGES